MRRHNKIGLWLLCTMMVTACVTINVYFPAAEAERAADDFIRDVLGDDAAGDPQTSLHPSLPRWTADRLLAGMLDLVIPSAHAQANIDINTPQIVAIKERMANRQQGELAAFFDSGAIGFSSDGLVLLRDRTAVGLKDRKKLDRLIAEENRDRKAVYREIAVANAHPEWEQEIRATFARRWISNARAGWYYQAADGSWTQK